MLNVDKKKVFTLFALTLLIAASLLTYFRMPVSAQHSDDMILHGPSLTPIHMHSNITLDPIHMHYTKGILWPGEWPITEPNCTTDWRRIPTTKDHDPAPDPPFEVWHLSSWEDHGDPIGELSPNDQIDMTNIDTQEVQWFHVDRMTLTLNLSGPYGIPWHEPAPTTLLLELKWPYYDPYIVYSPNLTTWHEVWPFYSNIYTMTWWIDDPQNPDGMLSYTDSVTFDGGISWWHVEEVCTDLILRWKMLDPIGTWWHELYPEYCEWYNITSWESYPDPYCDRISPRDTIDMLDAYGITHWYFVDRVTITINVTNMETYDWMMLELKTQYFEEMYNYIKHPLNSFWHEVYPVYSTVFNLSWWDLMDPLWDNCNGVLDPCDFIVLMNMSSGMEFVYHITDMAYDIILNEYITDPVGTSWHELWPDCSVYDYDVVDYSDNNGDGWLSPCDNVSLALIPTGETYAYHVENVTLTLNITVLDVIGQGPIIPGDRLYLDYISIDPMNWSSWWPLLYHPKIEPLDTEWQIVCPIDYFGELFWISYWDDNCNGVLSYCDFLELSGLSQGLYVHVDELAVDITVKKITEQPPPPPTWYKKPPYPDYAPSGMPDFDQKQDVWGPAPGWFTWCGPTAVANSLWWFDSKYDPSNILAAYPGVPDDHSVLNVDPFIRDLAWLMDTDDQRWPDDGHTGTFWYDMVNGIDEYLEQQGVNDTLEVHFMEDPEFFWIEDEIMRCQDVVLLLEFWVEVSPGQWVKADPYDFPGGDGGHYVTCAGVNSTAFSLLVCDPYFDAAEQGWAGEVPVPHAAHGDPTVHNDTQYVSHDAYNVIWPMSAPGPWWELVNGTGHGYLQQNMPATPPNVHTFITVAIATSPLAEEDVAVTNVTTIKDGCTTDFPTLSRGTALFTATAEVNVTVQNQDTGPATFNVTAYANMTTNGNMTAIGTQLVVNLPSGNSITLTFTWNSTSFAYGNYTVVGYAWPLPTETDTADNWFTGTKVMVTWAADISGDFYVGPYDFAILAQAYGATPWVPGPKAPYNPNADINGDKVIGPFDFAILAAYYGTPP